MDYLKLITEIYLRENGIDAVVTTVPKKKAKKVKEETNSEEKTA